jgi:hypothetical protein
VRYALPTGSCVDSITLFWSIKPIGGNGVLDLDLTNAPKPNWQTALIMPTYSKLQAMAQSRFRADIASRLIATNSSSEPENNKVSLKSACA